MGREKKILKRIFNFKVLFRFIFESIDVIKQGNSLRDKVILTIYFLRTPLFFIKSLYHNKLLNEVEEQYKFLKGNVTIKNKHGKFFCGNNIMAIYPVVNAYQKHFDPYMELEEGVFIDVGAHIGKYAIRLGNKLNGNGKVIAIEPEKNNFELLQTNVQLNNINNITCINKGAFSSKKELTLYVTPGPGEMYHSIYKQEEGWKSVTIEVDTLDNIVKNLNLNRVDFLKIDTEGAELDVIEGAKDTIKKYQPKILIEIWAPESLIKIKETLNALGYKEPDLLDEENYYFIKKNELKNIINLKEEVPAHNKK